MRTPTEMRELFLSVEGMLTALPAYSNSVRVDRLESIDMDKGKVIGHKYSYDIT